MQIATFNKIGHSDHLAFLINASLHDHGFNSCGQPTFWHSPFAQFVVVMLVGNGWPHFDENLLKGDRLANDHRTEQVVQIGKATHTNFGYFPTSKLVNHVCICPATMLHHCAVWELNGAGNPGALPQCP